MSNFVLVAGAWLGSWAWDEAVPTLREAGHGVYPLTLSGLADKQDVPAGQQTHLRDIVDEVERLDLRDVVLVGHSYSGIPVGQAAGRIGGRLARVVFVDSNVPADGESFVSTWWEGPAKLEAAIAENGGFWAPLAEADYDGQGLTDEQIGRIVGGSTPHPGVSLADPAVLVRPLGELPVTYIKCRCRAQRRRGQPADQRAVAAGRDGHRPLADVLSAGGTGPDPLGRGRAVTAV